MKTNANIQNLPESKKVITERKQEIRNLFQADNQRRGPHSLQEIIEHYKKRIGPESDFRRVNERKALSIPRSRKSNLALGKKKAFLLTKQGE